MKKIIVVCLLITNTIISQSYKDGVSIVQYSAPFVIDAELSLKTFRDYNTYTFYLDKNPKIFDKENIKSLPTICLYNNGELILKIESGISLQLPKNSKNKLEKEIDKLLTNKF